LHDDKLNLSTMSASGSWAGGRISSPSLVPCHRVIMSNGKIGGFSGNKEKNIKKKIEMLKKEGYKSKAF